MKVNDNNKTFGELNVGDEFYEVHRTQYTLKKCVVIKTEDFGGAKRITYYVENENANYPQRMQCDGASWILRFCEKYLASNENYAYEALNRLREDACRHFNAIATTINEATNQLLLNECELWK